MTKAIPQLIDDEWRGSCSRELTEVTDPTTQDVLALAPRATADEIKQAATNTQRAFETWREVPVPERARLMLCYQHLLKEHHDELGELLARETDKNLVDAKGDAWRGIEVVEHAANVASLTMGEAVESVACEIDTTNRIQPLDVRVGITPFSFPTIIPLWMFPLVIACDDTFVLKPSEQDPLIPNRLAELFLRVSAPKGVLQVIHGDRGQVDTLPIHPDIRAISLVDSVVVSQHVYRTGIAHSRRVQVFAGVKNYMVILPDTDKAQVLNNLVGANYDAAGQRCMAISVAVLVGATREWIPELTERMVALRPDHWQDPDTTYGPLISPQARQRMLCLIAEGKTEGAECLLDGSQCRVEGYPNGNWLGPTLFRVVMPKMDLYHEEIFGPILARLEVNILEETIALVNANPYGNGTSLFTRSGDAARRYQYAVQVNQVGINMPIPIPLSFFSLVGWEDSFCDDLRVYDKRAARFCTKTKTATSRWFGDKPATDESSAGPNITIHLK